MITNLGFVGSLPQAVEELVNTLNEFPETAARAIEDIAADASLSADRELFWIVMKCNSSNTRQLALSKLVNRQSSLLGLALFCGFVGRDSNLQQLVRTKYIGCFYNSQLGSALRDALLGNTSVGNGLIQAYYLLHGLNSTLSNTAKLADDPGINATATPENQTSETDGFEKYDSLYRLAIGGNTSAVIGILKEDQCLSSSICLLVLLLDMTLSENERIEISASLLSRTDSFAGFGLLYRIATQSNNAFYVDKPLRLSNELRDLAASFLVNESAALATMHRCLDTFAMMCKDYASLPKPSVNEEIALLTEVLKFAKGQSGVLLLRRLKAITDSSRRSLLPVLSHSNDNFVLDELLSEAWNAGGTTFQSLVFLKVLSAQRSEVRAQVGNFYSTTGYGEARRLSGLLAELFETTLFVRRRDVTELSRLLQTFGEHYGICSAPMLSEPLEMQRSSAPVVLSKDLLCALQLASREGTLGSEALKWLSSNAGFLLPTALLVLLAKGVTRDIALALSKLNHPLAELGLFFCFTGSRDSVRSVASEQFKNEPIRGGLLKNISAPTVNNFETIIAELTAIHASLSTIVPQIDEITSVESLRWAVEHLGEAAITEALQNIRTLTISSSGEFTGLMASPSLPFSVIKNLATQVMETGGDAAVALWLNLCSRDTTEGARKLALSLSEKIRFSGSIASALVQFGSTNATSFDEIFSPKPVTSRTVPAPEPQMNSQPVSSETETRRLSYADALTGILVTPGIPPRLASAVMSVCIADKTVDNITLAGILLNRLDSRASSADELAAASLLANGSSLAASIALRCLFSGNAAMIKHAINYYFDFGLGTVGNAVLTLLRDPHSTSALTEVLGTHAKLQQLSGKYCASTLELVDFMPRILASGNPALVLGVINELPASIWTEQLQLLKDLSLTGRDPLIRVAAAKTLKNNNLISYEALLLQLMQDRSIEATRYCLELLTADPVHGRTAWNFILERLNYPDGLVQSQCTRALSRYLTLSAERAELGFELELYCRSTDTATRERILGVLRDVAYKPIDDTFMTELVATVQVPSGEQPNFARNVDKKDIIRDLGVVGALILGVLGIVL